MAIKKFFILTTISSCLFGLALLFMPAQMGIWHGEANLNSFGKFTAQMLGGGLFAIGVLAWLSRDFTSPKVQKTILIFLFISDFLYTAANGMNLAQNGGGMPFQWLELGVTLIFALGAIYFLRKL